ncbi:hypothetical protein PoB_004570300 [Plakobranchus ocellatus]|uniref:Uncharacterized protein n=1 Tax=Plakobranchus ocellatus TaxID=259542 RepID=A0AAV4BK98_9GAST|nr:hypothetical protein PoB_004570300 [Plakobranchus ocellatus]
MIVHIQVSGPDEDKSLSIHARNIAQFEPNYSCDFDAEVGTEKVDGVVGRHGLGVGGGRGGRLIEWCQTDGIMDSVQTLSEAANKTMNRGEQRHKNAQSFLGIAELISLVCMR